VKARLKQKREDTFVAKRLREKKRDIRTTRSLHVATHQLVTPAPLSQTIKIKQKFGDDSNTALDYYFLAQRLPLVGLAGASWLSEQPAALKRFVWQNIAHLNILNFETVLPDVYTLCTAAPKLGSAQQALQILATNLVGVDVNEWIVLMTTYPHITGHQVLINLCNALDTTGTPLFPNCTVLKQCLGCGKDPRKNKWLRGLGLSWTQIKKIAARMASETEQIQTCTALNLVVMPVGADYNLSNLIEIWLEIDGCSVGNLLYLVQNYANLQRKTLITADMVARLLRAGLLRAIASSIYTTTYGKGRTFVFCFPKGRTRIPPEWHIHFQADGGKPAKCVGAGWKYQSEKHDVGVKAFNAQGSLPVVLKELNLWSTPRI
jgi:hypothetical protein